MKISSAEPGIYGSQVEIADTRKGGNSSWGVKDGDNENSIRLAWRSDEGRFDPISSAELPMWGLKLLIKTASKHDMLSPKEITDIIAELNSSINRQLP
jgi:hypothetical protein